MNNLSSSSKSTSCSLSLFQLRVSLQGIETPSEVEQLDPTTTIVQIVDPAQRYGTCHNYAFSKHLGLLGQVHTKLSIIGCGDWYHSYNILENFERVQKPKHGDIVIYKKSPDDTHITHTGIVDGDDFVESKWGIKRFICRHKTFHAPYNYGNHVEYYTARTSNAIIIETLQQKINCDVHLMNHRLMIKKHLIACAGSKRGLPYRYRYDYYAPDALIAYLLEFNLCCSVDTKKDRDKTLLMLAACVDNGETVKVLLEYGADVLLKDKNGNSALDIARQRKYTNIVTLLTKER